MWQDRFGYTYDEAAALIGITKTAASKASAQPPMLSPAQARTIYLLKLDGPLSTPAQVQAAAKLQAIPESHVGSSDDDGSNSVFCKLDGRAKLAIESWLSARNEEFRPLFVPFGRAYKELSSSSLYPTLGIDTTLPQFRPQDAHLLDHTPSFVTHKTSSPSALQPSLAAGRSFGFAQGQCDGGGGMATWGNGKYNALVDGPEGNRINGWAYHVASEEHEDALRKYETAAYEAVKCEIEMGDGTSRVQGCTFRFAGVCD
ncbi:hypothetical protein LZ554_002974 [Drepanopeziza brunnea f. sp. 'monogermtubi']|nr:hypothetical protein LZ554_002974 [Drepanopeziza brunnea f. sp. 'monogermtubi']